MTPLQSQILTALNDLGGTATAGEIAQKINRPTRSVALALCYMRGAGIVDDGSIVKPIIQNGVQVALLCSPSTEKPIRWRVE